ncbi:maltose alpha-D-glucosyltransferase/ alpha-amylase [Ruminococcus sp. YE71]|uniref:alpha-amylase family glycosyl hydrolase n=1 Tax=unclassified Ruminococcus TaxID=2608920 RepID=UPI0008800F22|nr:MULTISPECIES: alpha-amylase family glycosyl hydrolase [unclassified Ruminococcus]SDA16894.1 maltose alpha-D-glucosyltransferase/ alpha-amylase [Ruminococcus sp. YE78]SFW25771.1 maltose alpha-D-glucosyltransferase/ alpha-amylase [Ruminococcus sp. YE71]
MPEWLKNAVFYEIYPQSFCDSNGDGIGDIQGIIAKLGHIASLGCNAIWLNPCFESPFMDAGYDVSCYKRCAQRYGTNADLETLFHKAHELDMHVLLDLVPGHTSIEHKWFVRSCQPEENEYSDRYIWTDSVWTSPEGMGCIRGFCDRDGSCAVNFFSHQPALNYGFAKQTEKWQQPPDAPGPMATREAIKNVMRFWLSKGCDGFRVDMAGTLVKNDPDGSANIALWQDFRAFLDEEFPEAALISEWGEPDKSLMGGFHMDFLLHFGPSHYNDLFRCVEPYFSRRGKGSADLFVRTYLKNYKKTGGRGLICIPSGNHDMDRLARRLDEDEMKLAFAFLLSMPGAPFIYYGDEIGMNYVEGLNSKEGGYGRTGSRTPMQWDDSPNAGFSEAEEYDLYLPLDPSADRPTVEGQLLRKGSLMREVKRLIALRHEHSALRNDAKIIFVSSGYPLIYRRTDPSEIILVIINPSQTKYSLPIDITGETIYSTGKGEPDIMRGSIIMPPESAAYIKLK